MPDQLIRTSITEITISRLARDIARDIIPVTEILKIHQLSVPQYEHILGMKLFQQRLEEELSTWSTDARVRIAAKATAILEEGLLELFDLIHDKSQSMPAKIEALKFTSRLAAMENGAIQVNPDEKIIFNITINGEKKRYEQEAMPHTIEGSARDITQPGN